MSNESRERMEELATSVLVEAYVEANGRELLKENEQLQAAPEIDYSEEAKQRILAAIDAEFDRQRRQFKLHQFWKYAARAAVFIGLIFVLGTTIIFSVDAFRIRVLNTIIEYQERYTTMTSKPVLSASGVDRLQPCSPTWMPEGFALVERIDADPKYVCFNYEHPDGRWIQCTWQGSTGGTINVDTEDPIICKEITIHGCKAILVLKNEWRLYWIDYTLNSFFVLMADSEISETEFIAVAESIK